ncbi:hypothetical protein TrRE_jg1890 [Triparma retinervis]|uniref:Dihydroorotate dehydrogenase catalytic domain-containing protein n=1 Tax=Triparma retinervis TaxID=2557542 RepID=A0A9W7DKE7_9STRA|nr:hypothetical protein TrRE_jg1890 [Triparma retinervis]
MPLDLSTTICGKKLSTCIYNASGPRTGSSDALSKVASSRSGAVLAKSATVNEQTGNPLPRTFQADGKGSLNSEGLPNKGIDYYLSQDTIEESMGESGKPYFVSISGHNLADNLAMLKKIDSVDGVSGVELNLACPNVIGHPIIAYDFDQMDAVLSAVSKLKLQKPLGVKLPPYFDGPHFAAAAKVLNKYKSSISYAASINTVGNALVVDTVAEMPAISPKGGFGGLSGPAVKYTALANVKKMRDLLDETIDVVGVGGVETGEDAFQFLLCGAAAVQVGTKHWIEGAKCFDRIVGELEELMEKKGYKSVGEFRGKLKPWSKEGASKSRKAKKMSGGGNTRAEQAKIPVGKGGILPTIIVSFLLGLLLATAGFSAAGGDVTMGGFVPFGSLLKIHDGLEGARMGGKKKREL